MFNELEDINSRPKPFEFYTAAELWTDEHTSEQMLQFHLNESIDLSSRNHAFIDRSVEWIASQFNVTADTAIADFGCGPGLYTTRLAQTGADVTGIDFSPRSIDYAKAAAAEKNLDITYHCQNYLNFEADKRFDLIIMIFCDFKIPHLLKARRLASAGCPLAQHLQRKARIRHLRTQPAKRILVTQHILRIRQLLQIR
ncbi:MAG: class I SAM-dependent methyltransferase [Planctomycetota bacterium]